jgi:hypothetical protein
VTSAGGFAEKVCGWFQVKLRALKRGQMGPFSQRFLLAKYGVENGRKAMRSRTKKKGISRFL